MVNKDILMLCKELKKDDIKECHLNSIANYKFDGERILAIKQNEEVILMNRGSNICNANFREVVKDLELIKGDFIIDGEIITTDDDFTKLMKRARVKDKNKLKQREKEIPIKYMVFDILTLNNVDLRNKILKDRLTELNNLFYDSNLINVELAEYGDVATFLKKAKEDNREGIIIKNLNGLYESKKRSDNWLKVKFWKEDIFKAISYEINNAGIKVKDDKDRSVQISGEQHKEVKDLIDMNGMVEIEIQYLTKSNEGNYRFPSYKRIVGEV